MTFALVFTALFLLHAPLLRLPYFWDEAGYYVPAARDLLLTGSVIPHSTLSNAHPPLALAWLALWWKFSGYTPAVTRTAMLLLAALALAGAFRLSRKLANLPVALATTACTALYPVFFAQSSLAHADMAAAALLLWGLAMYFERRPVASTVWFCAAVLAKETAILVPLTIAGWELAWRLARTDAGRDIRPQPRPLSAVLALLLVPAVVLAAWYGNHYLRTGYIFGNPVFFQYNVASTLRPLRIAAALLKRLWQITGYMNLFLLTVPAAVAMMLPPQPGASGEPRPRIALGEQAVLGILIAAHVLALSVLGGAVLARYMLPVLPLVILLCVSTLWRRVRHWLLAILVVCGGFVLGLVVNPPYPFAMEDNLAYRDYVLLHKHAATLLAQHYPHARVLTAWPASDELTHSYLGFTKSPFRVVSIEDFSAPQIELAAHAPPVYDVALLFSTKYEPAHDLLPFLPGWQRLQSRFFGYHRDLPPELSARLLGGEVTFHAARAGQWIAIVDMGRVQNAEMRRFVGEGLLLERSGRNPARSSGRVKIAQRFSAGKPTHPGTRPGGTAGAYPNT